MPNNYFLIDLGETAIQRQDRIQAIRDAVPDGVTVPDWKLMDELFISATIAGLVALLQWVMLLIEPES